MRRPCRTMDPDTFLWPHRHRQPGLSIRRRLGAPGKAAMGHRPDTLKSSLSPFFISVLKRATGKSIRVKVPTDVNKLPKGRLHRTTVQVAGNNGAVTGSICCLVEDQDT